MHNETPTGRDPAPGVRSSTRMEVGDDAGRKRSGPRTSANACLVFLAGTTISGLLLHDEIHGASITVSSPVGGTLAFHVVCASGFMLSIAWHLVHKRRSLLAFAKRRSGKSLRCLFADVALAGLLVGSLLTALVGEGSSQVAHHMAVSLVLVGACAWHGVRRLVRRRRAARRALPQVQL